MTNRSRSRRSHVVIQPFGRTARASDEATKQAFAERIARQVLSMTPDEIDAFITERGLSHLADPERMAELLNAAVNLSEDGGPDESGRRSTTPFPSVGELASDLHERGERHHVETRLKH